VLSHLYVSPSQCQSFPTRRSSDLRIRTSCAPRTRLADLEGPRPARGTPADEEEEEETPAEASFQGRLEVRQGEQTPQEHGALHRSEEHTSELQSRFDYVCRLLLEQ